ncbi:MAG: DUF4872 domain-containing protein [Verrucomicrobiota bacterium]
MIPSGPFHFGGKHAESAALKNLFAWADVRNPFSDAPFSEALCFGIAGGIGAGYSFCPSVIRYGLGSGVSIVGRHKAYATDASWYTGFFERVGLRTHLTETSAPGKALQNLRSEISAGRPAVVWCSRARLPFIPQFRAACDLWMHTLVIWSLDETAQQVVAGDCAATPLQLTFQELADARAGICSHKNRTLTFEPPKKLARETLKSAVLAGIAASARELLEPRIKTFSLPGLEILAKMMTNRTNKDGWLKVFRGGLLYAALRDLFDSIETSGTGGSLYRSMYADFLIEAATITKIKALAELAEEYRALAQAWSDFANASLPDTVPAFAETRRLLTEQWCLYVTQGAAAQNQISALRTQLERIDAAIRKEFPLEPGAVENLLEQLRDRMIALHARELAAAKRLAVLK